MAETAYLIAGCGVSGKAAARLAAYLNLTYYLADENNTPELQAFAASLDPAPAGIFFGWNDSMALPHGVETVLSPGIRKGTPFRTALEKCSVRCYGELEFALHHLPCPYVGITGTNGKTTVTELTTALFCAAGVKAEAAGNIGAALSDAVIHARETALELAVIEISSFQLESMNTFPHPAAAALLNIASDHIDRHATLEEYAATKLRLFPSSRGRAILNKNTISYGKKYLPADTQFRLDAAAETGRGQRDGDRLLRPVHDGEIPRLGLVAGHEDPPAHRRIRRKGNHRLAELLLGLRRGILKREPRYRAFGRIGNAQNIAAGNRPDVFGIGFRYFPLAPRQHLVEVGGVGRARLVRNAQIPAASRFFRREAR